MKKSEAIVNTTSAESYMRKLGQHWSHRFPVEFNEKKSCSIEMPNGTCDLNVETETLQIRLTVSPEGDQDRFEKVVEEHLRRFAFREDLVFAWARSQV